MRARSYFVHLVVAGALSLSSASLASAQACAGNRPTLQEIAAVDAALARVKLPDPEQRFVRQARDDAFTYYQAGRSFEADRAVSRAMRSLKLTRLASMASSGCSIAKSPH